MSKINNAILESIDKNSAAGKNITEKEWEKIKVNKDKLFAKIPDSKKGYLESKYTELENEFNAEWKQNHKTNKSDLRELKAIFEEYQEKEANFSTIMTELNIWYTKKENFKTLLNTTYNTLWKDDFNKLVYAINSQNWTSDQREIFIELIKTNSLTSENINISLNSIVENEDFKLEEDKKEKSEIININEVRLKIEEWLKNKNNNVTEFLDDVFSNKLEWALTDFNEKEFSNLDKKEWFSEYELREFKTSIDKAIKRMNLLWSYDNFKETHKEADNDSLWWSNSDKFLAKRLDLNNVYIPTVWNINVTEKIFDFIWDWLSDLTNISKEELHKMREKTFDITSMENMKDFVILLWVEIWEWLEDMVKLILNIWAWITLAPRFINNKLKIDWEVDTKEEARLIIENERLLKENPSLALIELASNWMEVLWQMWEKIKSGTNWVVAMWVVSIAWLIAWWAGAIKFLSKWTKLSKVAWKVAGIADKVDNTISTGWLNHLSKISHTKKVSLELNKVYSEIEVSKLEVWQILQVKTKNWSMYEFTVLEKNKWNVVVEWSWWKETLKSLKWSIHWDDIKVGEQLFIWRWHTSNIKEIKILWKEVDKKTLEKNKNMFWWKKLELNKVYSEIEVSKLEVWQILQVKTKNWSMYEFTVLEKNKWNVVVEWSWWKETLKSLKWSIHWDDIKVGEQLFIWRWHTSNIKEIKILWKEVDKKTLEKNRINTRVVFEDFNKNMDDISSNFINKLGEAYIPRHVINIDWKEFLLTDKMNLGRKSIIAYTKVNWSYEPRLFYFSNSWWNWHVSPWIRSQDLAFSKWEIWGLWYEKWTVLNEKLSQKLETIPNGQNEGSIEDLHSLWFTDSKYQNLQMK